jgi:DNA polymerase-3 subunit alpha
VTCCPLHNHSDRSALDGFSTPEEIARRAEEIGAPAIALTDHGVVSGHLDFAKALTKRGIKPIFGCELYHGTKWTDFKGRERDQAHLIALAYTDEGLRNLWRLVDATAHPDKFRYVGRNSWDDIERYREGIIFTSACALGMVPQALLRGDTTPLDRYLEILGPDHFLLEVSTYPGDWDFRDSGEDEPVNTRTINELIVEVGLERGCEFIYGDDGHYAFPDQWEYHDAYLACSTKQTIYTPVEERTMYHPPGAVCIKDGDTVREALSYLPDQVVDNAIENSLRIAESCDVSLPDVRRHLPVFVPSDCPWLEESVGYDPEATGAEVFISLVERGIVRRYGEDAPDYVWDRAIREMEVFLEDESHLYDYFLLAWDVCEYCDHAGIERGPGRGSSAGCIVAYALGITDVDPLHYGLIFERFWNPGRAEGFPDIDSDFEKSRRREVREYLAERWGKDRVRSIGTVGRMKPKATIDRIWYGCDVTWNEKEELKGIVGETPDIDILGHEAIGWDPEIEPGKVIYVQNAVGQKIEEWVAKQPSKRQPILRKFIDFLRHICNRVENYGIHASGLVISDTDTPPELPCYLRGPKDDRVPATLFAMDDVDKRFFIKLDVLGLRTLDTLADWKRQMAERHGIDIKWSGLDLQDHPDEMWDLLADGYAAGIFQIESGYPKKLAEEFKPRSVEDLSIILALNRPGPIRSGAPDSFIVRRRGEEDDKFDGRKIPLLAEILEPTYGWFLYQEQVIAYFTALGYNLSDADAVRKILGKKKPEQWLALFTGEGEWAGKSYIEMAAKAGLGDLSGTQAANWDGRDVEDEHGKPLFPKVTEDAWVIWRSIVNFAKYSFNKSHTVAYAVIAFRCLFAKYYGDAEWYTSCIRTVPKDKRAERMPLYINEARRKGIEVLPPDIALSNSDVSIADDAIVFGLGDVKGVSSSGDYVVRLRNEMGVDISTPEKLFDAIEELNKNFLKDKKAAAKEGKPYDKSVKSPKQSLQANKIKALFDAGAWDNLGERELPLSEKQAYEKELLEVILTDNTDKAFENAFEEVAECDTYEDALESYAGVDTVWRLPGVVTNVRETKTREAQKAMGIVTIEYQDKELTFAVFPDRWRKTKFLWKERTPGIFTIAHTWNSKRNESGYHFKDGERLS